MLSAVQKTQGRSGKNGTQIRRSVCWRLCTFALAEVEQQDGLQQRVGVEGEVKLGAHFRLQGAFYPLVLRRRHPLDQGV